MCQEKNIYLEALAKVSVWLWTEQIEKIKNVNFHLIRRADESIMFLSFLFLYRKCLFDLFLWAFTVEIKFLGFDEQYIDFYK